ncbi:MAG: GH92 family glycosyl hydrolase [Crocinitomicaceae bacterium]|nr:GH92 family glycosyl hydrolase [Crocinitomicaceae bacterium]
MKQFLFFSILLFSLGATTQVEQLRKAQDQRKKYIDRSGNNTYFSKIPYVNPFIGTGGHGHTYPGATAPFGMLQLSPDTRHEGWDGCSGYHYTDSIIYGFSHTHLSGTGVSDYGDLLLVPQNGKPYLDPGYEVERGYGAKFTHKKEKATAGFYEVDLIDENIHVRLTTTERSGFHEYTFNNPDGKRFILIDLDHRDQLIASSIKSIDKNTVEGFRISKAWAENQHFYFHLKTDVPYQKARYFVRKGRNKLLLTFPRSTKKVNVKVGISAVDIEGAKNNLETEIPHWSFEATRAKVTQQWSIELDKIEFKVKDKDIMTNFYTALYHSYIAPNIFNDVDGRYRGRDAEIHQLGENEGGNYTVFSLWDTYRATHPLFTFTQVKRTRDFINTFIRQFEQGGDLPVWELAGNETECMIGYHSVSVIADAYTKGIRGFDFNKALNSSIATSNFDEFGKQSFALNGYIGTGDEPESVSKTLEYAYDDFCILEMLKARQKEAPLMEMERLIEEYEKRSLNFLNVYDPQTGFMRARRSGQWFSPFDPSEINFNYTEANSWQYSLYAPHAIDVLTDVMGGKDSLEAWLDRLFTTNLKLSGRHQVDVTGLIGQYAHGNEPSHHMAYMYNYTNSPYKTELYVDKILSEMYSNAPDGLSGNEDCGQMSSWYVLSSLGIYQMAPGRPYYEIGRPIMDEAIVHLDNKKSLKIKVLNNSGVNMYVENISLNGNQLKRKFISHEELTNGGILEITMGPKPLVDLKWEHAPTIQRISNNWLPIPYIETEERVFKDSLKISLNTIYSDKFDIYYTLKQGSSTLNRKYTTPFWINENASVSAHTSNGTMESATIKSDFVKHDTSVALTLLSKYANQYAGGGDFALIDGIQGNTEYRTGDWQGYWAQDVIAQLNFTEPKELSMINIGCLADVKSWIFLPKEVVFEVSFDGISWTEIGSEEFKTYPEIMRVGAHKYTFKTIVNTSIPIQSVRVTAKNHGKCPNWHLAEGSDTWLFVDEISYR